MCIRDRAMPFDRMGELSGSVATIVIPGMDSRRTDDKPLMVPPVPVVQITAPRSLSKSSMISFAVWRWDWGLAGL